MTASPPTLAGISAGRLPPEAAEINVLVNGAPQATAATTLQAWVAAQGLAHHAIATALNGHFVPRELRAERVLAEGDVILTFQPIEGG